MARVVGLLAVTSNQMLHAEIGSYADGERSLLLRALGVLSADDLLVLDRGYPAWWLFALFAQRGVAFCADLRPPQPRQPSLRQQRAQTRP